MDTTRNDRQAVFTYLMASGSMVKMTTGAVFNGVINNDYVVVHEASSRVVKEIVTNFVMVSLRSEGLLIPITPMPKN